MTNDAVSRETSMDADPIDEEAATIDARSPDAPERIEELVEDAHALGRDAELPGDEVIEPPT